MRCGRLPAAFAAALLSGPASAQAPSVSPPATTPLEAPAPEAPKDGPRLAPGQPIPPLELEAFVDTTVRLGMDEGHVAGVAVAVVQGGRVVLKKGYGFASFDPLRPVDPDTTLFRIGSITKTFTWIAAMRAVEAGKLDLDAPVNRYLPVELQIPDDGFAQPIRMRDLMTHSAGFEDRFAGIMFVFDPERLVSLESYLRDYRTRRVREPGAATSYSNYGASLAGAVVGAVEGTPWHDLVERDILAPLGLARTTTREPYPPRADLPAPMAEALARDVSTAFRWNGATHVPREFEFVTPAPAGAISATAGDMARYLLLLLGDGTLDGVTVFGPTAARAFRTPMTSYPVGVGALDAGFFDMLLPGGFHGYGHAGATLTFFSSLLVVPELDLGIFVTTNTERGGALSNPFPARVIEHFYAPPGPAPESTARELAASNRAYAGDYVSTRRRDRGLESFLTRFANAMSVSVSSDGALVVSGVGPTQRFVPATEPDVFRPAAGPVAGGMLWFERDGERVVRAFAMPTTFDRVGMLHRPAALAIAAVLAASAALAIFIGSFVRLARKRTAESRGQTLARRVQLAAAVLWLVAIATFALWITGLLADITGVFRDWPGPLLSTASFAALAASGLTLLGVLLLPAVWRNPRDARGWTAWRKGRYTLALTIFAVFGVLLGAWGALEPWAA